GETGDGVLHVDLVVRRAEPARQVCEGGRRSATTTDATGLVGRDREEPGGRRSPARVELAPLLPGPDERLLDDVVAVEVRREAGGQTGHSLDLWSDPVRERGRPIRDRVGSSVHDRVFHTRNTPQTGAPVGSTPSLGHGVGLGALGWPEPAPRLDLDSAVGVLLRRMLDEGDQPARHEPAGPHRRAAAGDLADLDDATGRRHLESAAVLRRDDVEGLNALAGVDDDLDAIASHAADDSTVESGTMTGWVCVDGTAGSTKAPSHRPWLRAPSDCSRPRSARVHRPATRRSARSWRAWGHPLSRTRRACRSIRSTGSATLAGRACPTGSPRGAAVP